MAASKSILVAGLYRIAKNQGNPIGYLTDILQGRYTRVLAGTGRVIISGTTGGSSSSWSIPEGMNDLEIMELAELALQQVETEVNSADPETGTIGQVSNAQRLISYGQFSRIQR